MSLKSLNEKGNKPLETLTIEINGNPVPALSQYFAESHLVVPYSAPPNLSKDGQFVLGAKDSWLQKMDVYAKNLHWLEELSHHKFWSQVIYGADMWDSVISFLQNGYPFYALDGLPEDEEIKAVYYEIYHSVFNIFKRAMTKKENESHFIGKKYGSLLYNYSIISIPMMIDLCALYGERFHRETGEMIKNMFAAQPLYAKDLERSIQTVKMAFTAVEGQLTGRHIVPGNVTKLTEAVGPAKSLTITDLQDLVYYLLDLSASLTAFLNTYEPAATVFHNHKFEIYIARLYALAFPIAVHKVQVFCDNDETMSLYFTLMFKLNNARFYFIQLFRLCIQQALSAMINDQSSAESQAYLDTMTDCLAFTTFMKDYHSKFPIDHDLDSIAQHCPDFDNIKYNFLLESLLACFDKSGKQSAGGSRPPPPRKVNNSEPRRPVIEEPPSSNDVREASANNLETTQLKIAEVKECLPHLGDGFILKCLEHFHMSPSAAIDAILDNTLPNEIESLDRELPYIPPEESTPYPPEFDELGNGNEKTYSVHKGKRQDAQQDLKEMLDDKSFRKECKNTFSQLGIIESLDNVYDDEYDDTYDDSEPPVPEIEEPDRKFVVPRVLQQRKKTEEIESEEEEDEEESEEALRRSQMNFCENPEDVRARYAQKRLANMKHPPGPKKDLVGNPRGQGQDNSVLRARHNKTVGKSANRKKAAAFKKGRMF